MLNMKPFIHTVHIHLLPSTFFSPNILNLVPKDESYLEGFVCEILFCAKKTFLEILTLTLVFYLTYLIFN